MTFECDGPALELIHARPVSANVRWGDIEALFRELGAEISERERVLGSGLSFAHFGMVSFFDTIGS